MDVQIAVTGYGAVSGFGIGVGALWDGLISGRSAVGKIERFDVSSLYTQLGVQVPPMQFDPWELGASRAVAYGAVALREALADAGLAGGTAHDDAAPADARRALVVGTTLGGMEHAAQAVQCLDDDVPNFAAVLRNLPYHALADALAPIADAAGEAATTTTACASSLTAIEHATRLLRTGRADVVVAGGADALSEFVYAGFASLWALAPERAQPFDAGRKGLVLGEGAGFVVLERVADARARGAAIRAVVAGCGSAGDAHHLTGPHKEGEGLRLAIERALTSAGRDAGTVGYVNAHGTATPFNDRMESIALARAGGAEWARAVPVSSTKPATGHCLGAAGAIETIACIRALESGTAPPTLNFETADTECPVDCIPGAARELPELQHALTLAAGFGGHNAALLLAREPRS